MLVQRPETGMKYSGPDPGCGAPPWCDWSTASSIALKEKIKKLVPRGEALDNALAAVSILEPTAKSDDWDKGVTKKWLEHAGETAFEDYLKNLAKPLHEIGCSEDGAPYVIHAVLENEDEFFAQELPETRALAAAFLSERECPGARGLSEKDKAKLRDIRDRAPRQSE